MYHCCYLVLYKRCDRKPTAVPEVYCSKANNVLEKMHHAWCVFSKPCTKLTLHCNHRSGHLKTEHTESPFLLRRHLRNWPRSKHEKRNAGSAWETWTVAAADGVRCARVRWEINFLLTFETAPFICVHPVYFILSFKIMYLNAWGRSELPKHVACRDKAHKICCISQQHVCQF